MNTQSARKSLYNGFVLVLVLALSACGGGTNQSAPIAAEPSVEVVVNTPTLMKTPTPQDTSTPEATATLTNTPEPTATSTPDVTPTLLPEITPAAEGKGNIVGLVLWNGEPVAQAAVWLCEKFTGNCVGTYQYRANTDANGYYVFKNVVPGRYLVAINSFSTGWFIFYFDAEGNRFQEVKAGENLILNPWSIWKINLLPISPKNGKDMAEAHPTFSWEPYPGAAYYQFSIYDTNFKPILEEQRVDGTEFVLEEVTLVTCTYYWTVEAYSEQGVKISQLKAPSATVMKLIIHSVPGSC